MQTGLCPIGPTAGRASPDACVDRAVGPSPIGPMARAQPIGPGWSEPAVLLGDPDRLGAGAGAGLADRRGEVVAHRSLGEVQRPRRGRPPCRRRGRRAARRSPARSAGCARWPGSPRPARVDHPQAGVHPADGVGELPGRGVLDHEAAGAGLHRPAQVAGPAERGDHQHPARRQRGAQRRRWPRCRPARASRRRAGRRRVGPRGPRPPPRRPGRPRRPPRGRAPAEQRGQRAADQRLVVGEQQPDRSARRHAHAAAAKPPPPDGPADGERAARRPPARAARPARDPPELAAAARHGPRPSSAISTWSGRDP